MWLDKIADAIYKIAVPFSKVLLVLGGFCLAVMMFLTTSDVTLRYFFNRPISGAFDITEYMMAVVFAFGLPYCIINKGHVRVDMLTRRFSEKAQAVINTLTTPLGLGLFTLIAWQSIEFMKIQFDSHIVSSVLKIPQYPFVGLLFIGYAGFAVVLLADLLRLISAVTRK
ncbi:MAG: TRAP transporter small permease [Chloroflexota bacterium]